VKQPEDKSRRRFLEERSVLGLAVAFSPGTIGEVFADSKSKNTKEEDTMNQTSAIQRGSEQAADKSAIRPFNVNVPETELTELRRRIKATKWPEREIVSDASQGVQLKTMRELASYWATQHDWRKSEGRSDPDCRERISRRALPSPPELDRESLSETDSLQPAPERHALRGVGAAESLFRRAPHELQITAVV